MRRPPGVLGSGETAPDGPGAGLARTRGFVQNDSAQVTSRCGRGDLGRRLLRHDLGEEGQGHAGVGVAHQSQSHVPRP